jgi:hypothetical protein
MQESGHFIALLAGISAELQLQRLQRLLLV